MESVLIGETPGIVMGRDVGWILLAQFDRNIKYRAESLCNRFLTSERLPISNISYAGIFPATSCELSTSVFPHTREMKLTLLFASEITNLCARVQGGGLG